MTFQCRIDFVTFGALIRRFCRPILVDLLTYSKYVVWDFGVSDSALVLELGQFSRQGDTILVWQLCSRVT